MALVNVGGSARDLDWLGTHSGRATGKIQNLIVANKALSQVSTKKAFLSLAVHE